MLKSGTGLALWCALFWGLAPVFEKVGLRQVPALTGVFVRSVVVTLLVGGALAAAFVLHRESLEAPAFGFRPLLWIAAGGLFGGVLAQYLYYLALGSGEVSRVAPIASAFPLVTVACSILFLDESLTWTKALGAGLIVAGVMLLR